VLHRLSEVVLQHLHLFFIPPLVLEVLHELLHLLLLPLSQHFLLQDLSSVRQVVQCSLHLFIRAIFEFLKINLVEYFLRRLESLIFVLVNNVVQFLKVSFVLISTLLADALVLKLELKFLDVRFYDGVLKLGVPELVE